MTGAADEADDPKQAMRDRGIVRKVGKKHYAIIVPAPPGTTKAPAGATLYGSTLYFGELGKLRVLPGESWGARPVENRAMPDWRDQYSASFEHVAGLYTFVCTDLSDPEQPTRRIELTSIDDDAAKDAIDRATILPADEPYRPFLLARVNPTTYLFVDRKGTQGTSYRLFLGKRGAAKRLPIKEISDDSDALTLVTAKGTLTATWAKDKVVTWGSGRKKPPLVKVLDLGFNRALVRDLGVYIKEPSGHPCHEL